MKHKQNFRKPVIPRISCKCGKSLKQKTKTNYPFGSKSKARVSTFYKCPSCGYRTN